MIEMRSRAACLAWAAPIARVGRVKPAAATAPAAASARSSRRFIADSLIVLDDAESGNGGILLLTSPFSLHTCSRSNVGVDDLHRPLDRLGEHRLHLGHVPVGLNVA